ncbi:hypothetical protein [Jiangella asiatica]|uniref:Uncharacterized protein n=1 Tax=Jiangella asiatica TaxID=2530372 RepID=A0A4V2Z3G6_9ACTN|nr:hypothetical protein [Jiangella asiatica]TDE12618.1 hypothetical protein E1269_07210 [Jiangella asiatica]
MRIGTRLLVVAALVLGIVMMHHVARSGHEAVQGAERTSSPSSMVVTAGHDEAGSPGASSTDHGEPDHSSSAHGLLHLCVAVLTAAVLLVLGRLAHAGRLLPAFLSATAAVVRRVFRPPPPRPAGWELLTSLCVMRT